MIADILNEREAQYGDYREVAHLSQMLKAIASCGKNWNDMYDFQRESIDMLFSKLARILNGDYMKHDSWLDAEGYMKLSADLVLEINQGKTGSGEDSLGDE